MSAFGREAVYAGLFTFIGAALEGSPTPAVTVSRSAQHYSKVDPLSQMPAVFQLQKGEQVVRKRGLNEKVTLMAELLIYTAATQDNSTPASTAINNIIDTIDNALSANIAPNNNQTLGMPEVVEHAWIEGKVEIYEGILLNISIAIVPIHILCTG
jgi:hypothetical protein